MLKDWFNRIKSEFEIYNSDDPFSEKETTKRKMRKQINSLIIENYVLRDVIKDELLKQFLEKIGEPERIIRLTEENKHLRQKVKALREDIKKLEDKKGVK